MISGRIIFKWLSLSFIATSPAMPTFYEIFKIEQKNKEKEKKD
jgi:hypothetical protein